MTITITNASDKILFCCQFILRSQKKWEKLSVSSRSMLF